MRKCSCCGRGFEGFGVNFMLHLLCPGCATAFQLGQYGGKVIFERSSDRLLGGDLHYDGFNVADNAKRASEAAYSAFKGVACG
jgi:hypothetical protein